MATKTIDVTLATIRNVGRFAVGPKGVIRCAIARAVDDEQIFQVGLLYSRLRSEDPIHPSGARGILPGQSLSYNVTKRLTLNHFDQETEGHLNQMLIFSRDLKEDLIVDHHLFPDRPYQGDFIRKVRFEEIDGFNIVTCGYQVIFTDSVVRAEIAVVFTVTLISG